MNWIFVCALLPWNIHYTHKQHTSRCWFWCITDTRIYIYIYIHSYRQLNKLLLENGNVTSSFYRHIYTHTYILPSSTSTSIYPHQQANKQAIPSFSEPPYSFMYVTLLFCSLIVEERERERERKKLRQQSSSSSSELCLQNWTRNPEIKLNSAILRYVRVTRKRKTTSKPNKQATSRQQYNQPLNRDHPKHTHKQLSIVL